MKAVIMAGGEGSRLRPLTCDIPKPMARLCGRPIIEYILDLLAKHRVTDASVTVRYLPNAITSHFESMEYAGIRLQFVEEDRPLGTAGSVKNAVGGVKEDFIVISGDALCDIDLSAAVAHHKKTGADATLVVTRVADPREYGLVTYRGDSVVTGFVEKPGWNQAYTDAANTGIYILSPGCLSLIPDGQNYDFAKNLFVEMLSRGMKICAFETSDYWCDIGNLETYQSCQKDILTGKVRCSLPQNRNGLISHQPPRGDYRVIEPVYIGDNVKIGNGAIIGPNTVLDDGVTVGALARVRESILLPGSFVGDRARLTGAVLCAGASVKTGGAVFEGAAVGTGAQVGAGAEVMPGVRIWPGKVVEDGSRLSENLQYGNARPDLFDDEGISGEAGVELTPEFCARVGAASGSVKGGARIGVACGEGRAAKAFKSAFIAGALSTGSHIWDFGEMLESQMAFAVSFCGLSVSAFISGGQVCSIRILGEYGLPIGRPLERELEGHLMRGEFVRCPWNAYQDIADMSGIRMLYQQELYNSAPKGLSGMQAKVTCPNREGERIFEDTLARLGCDTSAGMTLNLSKSGTKLSVNDSWAGYLPPERVLAICCLIEFKEGKDVVLPFDAPRAVDAIAARYGRRVIRYYSCPADYSDREARADAKNQLWVRDGMMAAIKLLHYLKSSGTTIAELAGEIPKFATILRSVPLKSTVADALSGLPEDRLNAGEGITIRRESGSLLITPGKRGKSLRVLAEASSSETAEELCAEIEKVISNTALDTNTDKG